MIIDGYCAEIMRNNIKEQHKDKIIGKLYVDEYGIDEYLGDGIFRRIIDKDTFIEAYNLWIGK